MLTIPNFERLKIFHIVYLNKNIQKAADVLNVTRSAVSQSLKALEQEVGLKLFIRDSKKIQATRQGEELFKAIHPFVNELHITLQGFESGQKIPVGHLRIGAPQGFGSNLLTKIIGEFSQKFPDISFELILAVPVKQLELLTRGELDIALIDNGDIHAQKFPVTIQTLLKEDFVLAVNESNYKKWTLRECNFSKLSEIPFVDYLVHAPVTKMWFKHHFAKVPHNLKIKYSAENVQAVLNAIKSGLGAGVVPSHLISNEFADLKIIPTTKKPFINEIMLARQQGSKATAREQEFIKFLKSKLS